MIFAANNFEFFSSIHQSTRVYQLLNHKPGGDVLEFDGLSVSKGNGRDYNYANSSSSDSQESMKDPQYCAHQKWAEHN